MAFKKFRNMKVYEQSGYNYKASIGVPNRAVGCSGKRQHDLKIYFC